MKKTIFLILFTLACLFAQAQDSTHVKEDSLTFAFGDLNDLFKYAKDGYYLAKIDTLNGLYIISLEKEIKGLRTNVEKLELIVEKDTKLIENLFRVLRNRQLENEKLKVDNRELSDLVKRLRREKLNAIIGGATATAIIVLMQIIK